MRIETFNNLFITYKRRTGPYGSENTKLMNSFKKLLDKEQLLHQQAVILGIALDNPSTVPSHQLRYDVGLIVPQDFSTSLPLAMRKLDEGSYLILEVEHTEAAVSLFWSNLESSVNPYKVDYSRPIIERYQMIQIREGLCEFCVPIL